MLSSEQHSTIYLKIPALLFIEKIQNDRSIKRPITISYRNAKHGAEWICNTEDDFINLTRYFRRARGSVAFGDLSSNIFVYKVGYFHGEFHVDIADYARLISPKANFPEFHDDSLSVDSSNISLVWEDLKLINFDRLQLRGAIIRRRNGEEK